jgi:hypothetical protein
MKVKCDFFGCRFNEEGFCKKDVIQLTPESYNKVVCQRSEPEMGPSSIEEAEKEEEIIRRIRNED